MPHKAEEKQDLPVRAESEFFARFAAVHRRAFAEFKRRQAAHFNIGTWQDLLEITGFGRRVNDEGVSAPEDAFRDEPAKRGGLVLDGIVTDEDYLRLAEEAHQQRDCEERRPPERDPPGDYEHVGARAADCQERRYPGERIERVEDSPGGAGFQWRVAAVPLVNDGVRAVGVCDGDDVVLRFFDASLSRGAAAFRGAVFVHRGFDCIEVIADGGFLVVCGYDDADAFGGRGGVIVFVHCSPLSVMQAFLESIFVQAGQQPPCPRIFRLVCLADFRGDGPGLSSCPVHYTVFSFPPPYRMQALTRASAQWPGGPSRCAPPCSRG